MPIYTYRSLEPCDICHGRQERMQKMSEDRLAACPDCGKAIERTVSLPQRAIIGGGGSRLSDAAINRSGMTKYVNRGDGTYEKAAGPADSPATIDRGSVLGND
ncbi:MAG TPA: zinc ribbon domain-containing protein [Gemmata sp.]|nr:zinc ribbon domain-containing protein [Gemmata sp.]